MSSRWYALPDDDDAASAAHPLSAHAGNIVDALAMLPGNSPPRSATELLHDYIDLTAATTGCVPAQRIRQARLELAS